MTAALTALVLALAPAMPEPAPHWQEVGCKDGHGYEPASRGVMHALRHHRPLTKADGRRAWHFVLCVRDRGDVARLKGERRNWLAWRQQYAHKWPIRFNALEPWEQAWARSTSMCESHGNPATSTGNGFYGAFQFMLSTWYAAGGTGNPAQHSWHYQAVIAVRLMRREGAGHWPNCG